MSFCFSERWSCIHRIKIKLLLISLTSCGPTMSSRLLAAARLAAARFAGNCRTATNLPARGFSLNDFMARLKHEIMHPETKPEKQGLMHYRNPYFQWSLSYRIANELLMASFWYWLMFHFYFEHAHPDTPDPSKWTDEELGIPPLDEEGDGMM